MKGILDYLEASAEKFPDKTAVACGDVSYSFKELVSLSRRIGAEISKHCSAGRPIAVLVRRSAETACAFFGAVYNGDYYIPVDPSMPSEKIKAVLNDSGASVVIGDSGQREILDAADYSGVFLSYDTIGTEELDAPAISDAEPLYMVYTSGSTGKPKGVIKSHRAVKSFIKAFTETFKLSENEVIGNQTPFFFDASAKDLYQMLYTGATLEVIPSEYFMLPTALIEYLNNRKITYICWVPTALTMVVRMNAFRKYYPETLRKVFFVGEVFPAKMLRAWADALPDVEYVNLYGSSEIAGICSYYRIDRSSIPDVLPLGKALSNCELFICDDGEIITEPGRTGELYVAGDALAIGYYNDPDRTAERFIEMITPSGELKRVFKTGDLARYENGMLIFVSRADYQIKYLGKRIELGEIEAAADRINEVRRCCCLFDKDVNIIRLFCELEPDSRLSGKDIRDLLKSYLSDYMLPHKVLIIDSIPLNANGKINRTLLSEIKN